MPSGWLNGSGPRRLGPQRHQIHRSRCHAVSHGVGWMTNLRLAKPLGRCLRLGQESRHRQQPRLSSRWRSTVPRRCPSYIWRPMVGGDRFCLFLCRFRRQGLPFRSSSVVTSSIHHVPVPGRPLADFGSHNTSGSHNVSVITLRRS